MLYGGPEFYLFIYFNFLQKNLYCDRQIRYFIGNMVIAESFDVDLWLPKKVTCLGSSLRQVSLSSLTFLTDGKWLYNDLMMSNNVLQRVFLDLYGIQLPSELCPEAHRRFGTG